MKKAITKAQRGIVADALVSWAETFGGADVFGGDDTRTAGKIRAAARRIRKDEADLTDIQFAQFHLEQQFQEDADYDDGAQRAAVDAFFGL